MLHLVYTQGVSEDLHSNVKVMKNARRKAGAEKSQAEEQKIKQVDRLKSGTLKYQIGLSFDCIRHCHRLIYCY